MFLPLLTRSFLGKAKENDPAYLALFMIDKIEKALQLHEEISEYQEIIKHFLKSAKSSNDYYEVVSDDDRTISLTYEQISSAVNPESESPICIAYRLGETIYDFGELFVWSSLTKHVGTIRISIMEEVSKVYNICTKLNAHQGMEYLFEKDPLGGFLENLEEMKHKLILLTGGS